MPAPSSIILPLVREVRPLLRTQWMGRRLEGHARIGSTNTRAAAWAAEGAPAGSTVVADEQTHGRGRHGRTWHGAPGQNLHGSVILCPALAPDRRGRLVMAAAVAAAATVEAFAGPHRVALKWPNDVLLNARKCCGILLEAALRGDASRGDAGPSAPVILGIGVNVNQQQFPEEIVRPATSLLLETGQRTPRAPLLARLLHELEAQYEALMQDTASTHRAYTARLTGVDRPCTLRFAGSDRRVQGRLAGVTENGALRLATDTEVHTFHAGEVTTDFGV